MPTFCQTGTLGRGRLRASSKGTPLSCDAPPRRHLIPAPVEPRPLGEAGPCGWAGRALSPLHADRAAGVWGRGRAAVTNLSPQRAVRPDPSTESSHVSPVFSGAGVGAQPADLRVASGPGSSLLSSLNAAVSRTLASRRVPNTHGTFAT